MRDCVQNDFAARETQSSLTHTHTQNTIPACTSVLSLSHTHSLLSGLSHRQNTDSPGNTHLVAAFSLTSFSRIFEHLISTSSSFLVLVLRDSDLSHLNLKYFSKVIHSLLSHLLSHTNICVNRNRYHPYSHVNHSRVCKQKQIHPVLSKRVVKRCIFAKHSTSPDPHLHLHAASCVIVPVHQ
jgi:hypothetical protein